MSERAVQCRFDLEGAGLLSSKEVLNMLHGQVSSQRWEKTTKVVAGRTFSVIPVLEGINDKGNIGAVARTAEALGYGALHYIRSLDPAKVKTGSGKRSSMGSQKWMDMQVWDSTESCLQHMKEAGYFIAATHLAENSIPITDLDWSRPTAVIMGNEAFGVSHAALKYADQPVIIPQAPGFVDSFNVSVAAALILYEAFAWRMRHSGKHGDLSEDQQRILMAAMLLRHKDYNAVLRKRCNLSLERLEELNMEAVLDEAAWEDVGKERRMRNRVNKSVP